MKLIRDLFMGPGNQHWDLARILGAKAVTAYTAAFLYALIKLGNVPDWSALGVGYTGVLGGVAALILGKDFSAIKAKAAAAGDKPAGAEP